MVRPMSCEIENWDRVIQDADKSVLHARRDATFGSRPATLAALSGRFSLAFRRLPFGTAYAVWTGWVIPSIRLAYPASYTVVAGVVGLRAALWLQEGRP